MITGRNVAFLVLLSFMCLRIPCFLTLQPVPLFEVPDHDCDGASDDDDGNCNQETEYTGTSTLLLLSFEPCVSVIRCFGQSKSFRSYIFFGNLIKM